jgi:hypothetical protein
MDFKEIGWEVVDCVHLAQDSDQWRALVNIVMKPLCMEAEKSLALGTVTSKQPVNLQQTGKA